MRTTERHLRYGWRAAWAAAALVIFGALPGCRTLLATNANPDFRPAKPHHRPDGFANRYLEPSAKEGLWRWQWERLRDGLPKPPAQPVIGVEPDLREVNSPTGKATVTWVGHATMLLQVDGLNVLTDPHWGNRASPLRYAGPRRHQPPGIPFEALPRIDAVLISHNHYDHLDQTTVQRLMDTQSGVRFFVPLGVQHWFHENVRGTVLKGNGRNVFALDWDDTFTLRGRTGEATLVFLAVQHWSARTLRDRYRTLWGSWAVLHPDFRFWFSGDLGYSQDTRDIGQKLGRLDLAAIAIGAYEPRWFMRESHLNPAEAVQVMKEVNARSALAIHWGTFEGLTDEPLDQPPRDLGAALRAEPVRPDFRVLRHGQAWVFVP